MLSSTVLYQKNPMAAAEAWGLLFNDLLLCIYFYMFDLFYFEKISTEMYIRSGCIVKWVDGCRDGLLVPENCLIRWVTAR